MPECGYGEEYRDVGREGTQKALIRRKKGTTRWQQILIK